MIKKILVPTDGSEHATKAVRFAADLAAKYGAEIVLLHVLLRGHLDEGLRAFAEIEGPRRGRPLAEAIAAIPEARFPVSMVPTNGGDTEEAVLAQVAEHVLRVAERAAHAQGATRTRSVVEDGDAAQRILQAAKDEGVDLIVMGSRGFSDLKGLLVGSVSHKVSHVAPCTVMTVR